MHYLDSEWDSVTVYFTNGRLRLGNTCVRTQSGHLCVEDIEALLPFKSEIELAQIAKVHR